MTALELSCACALLIALASVTYSSIATVTAVRRLTANRLLIESTGRKLMKSLQRELEFTSLTKDPWTNKLHFSCSTDDRGKQFATFEKVAGVRLVEGELRPTWSPTVRISTNRENEVTRTQNGLTDVMAKGIKQLSFEKTPAGKIKISYVYVFSDPSSGKTREIARDLSVRPRY